MATEHMTRRSHNAVVSHLFDKAGKIDVGLKIVVSVNNNGTITNTESTDKVTVTINSIAVADAGGPYDGQSRGQYNI